MLIRDELYQAAKAYLEAHENFKAIRILADYACGLALRAENETIKRGATATANTLLSLRIDTWCARENHLARMRMLGHYCAGHDDESWIAIAEHIVARYERKGLA